MSPCDRIAETVVSGEALTADDRAHLDGCAACQRLTSLPGMLAASASAPAPRPGFSARMMVAGRQRLGQRRRRRIAGVSLALVAAAASAVMIDRQLIRHADQPATLGASAVPDAAALDDELLQDLESLRHAPMAPVARWDDIEAPVHRYYVLLRQGGSP